MQLVEDLKKLWFLPFFSLLNKLLISYCIPEYTTNFCGNRYEYHLKLTDRFSFASTKLKIIIYVDVKRDIFSLFTEILKNFGLSKLYWLSTWTNTILYLLNSGWTDLIYYYAKREITEWRLPIVDDRITKEIIIHNVEIIHDEYE